MFAGKGYHTFIAQSFLKYMHSHICKCMIQEHCIYLRYPYLCIMHMYATFPVKSLRVKPTSKLEHGVRYF